MDIVEKMVENKVAEFTSLLLQSLINLVNIIIAILCIAAIGYILYHCVCIMFFQKELYVQKIIFGCFALILFRIMGALVAVKLR
ncbi:MAG: hypothetical protein WDA59_00175 [Methanofastidiosum sp.]|jgi:hypothetical protein